MKKIGDRFMAELCDGRTHLLKAVKNTGSCFGCDLKAFDNCYGLCEASIGNDKIVIKDLGVPNEEGCLPAPWDNGLYPTVYSTKYGVWFAYAVSYGIEMWARGETMQEAIDQWNRR